MVTKNHRTSHARNADDDPDDHAPPEAAITPRQQQALQVLLTGSTDTDASQSMKLAEALLGGV